MYVEEDFKYFVASLQSALTPDDVLSAWLELESDYNSLSVVSALPDYQSSIQFPGTNIRDLEGEKAFTPMFLNDSLYFSSRELISDTFKKGQIKLPLDSSIMFDTNIASYIDAYMNRRNLGRNQAKVVHLITELLNSDANYDYIYYLIENLKQFIIDGQVVKYKNVDDFWRNINQNFKSNLISLRLFNSIDNALFKKNGSETPTITYDQAEKEAKDYTYNFYFGEMQNDWLSSNVLRRLTVAKIFIYKALTIYFDTGEGIKKKVTNFLNFMIEDVGNFFEREMMMVVRFFEEGKSFKFFEKVDKGKHIPSKKTMANVENMAWDMVFPRLVEYFSQHLGDKKHFIPYVLTWDRGLRQALDMHKAKAMIYDSKKGASVLVPQQEVMQKLENTIGFDLLNRHFNKDAVTNRHNAKAKSTKELIKMENRLSLECIEVLQR